MLFDENWVEIIAEIRIMKIIIDFTV